MKNNMSVTNNRVPETMRNLGIVDQVKQSMHRKNRIAMALGSLLGAFVPVATYTMAHVEVDASQPLYFQIPSLLVLSGLVYSAMTVFSWAKVAFKHPAKALGFVALTEGTMTFSHSGFNAFGVHVSVLSIAALMVLVGINAVAAGTMLVLDQKQSRKK